MEDLKPIKRHPALLALSREHHFGLLLIWKVRQGIRLSVNNDQIRQYILFFFREDLQKHFNEEERSLFPLLSNTDELRRKAEIEHDTIRKLIAALEDDHVNPELISKFADTLEAHIRFEERHLFGHLQEMVESQKLIAALENAVPHEDVDSRWDDKFWVPSKAL